MFKKLWYDTVHAITSMNFVRNALGIPRHISDNLTTRMYSTSRPEGRLLRRRLIERRMIGYECDCSMCMRRYPLYLLETAHLRPRHTLSRSERQTLDCVELMCRICHSIYDNGFVSVNHQGTIQCREELMRQYDHLPILSSDGLAFPHYSLRNEPYFSWHYEHVFRGK